MRLCFLAAPSSQVGGVAQGGPGGDGIPEGAVHQVDQGFDEGHLIRGGGLRSQALEPGGPLTQLVLEDVVLGEGDGPAIVHGVPHGLGHVDVIPHGDQFEVHILRTERAEAHRAYTFAESIDAFGQRR